MIKSMLIAGCGGFIGTCGRYLIGRWASGMFCGSFPLGTFMVNVIGCFIIGIIFGLIERTNLITQSTSILLITGFCGGFTTFSAFANEIWSLSDRGEWITALAYLIASIVFGVVLVWLGRLIICKSLFPNIC